MSAKQIYLARRNAALTPGDFARVWREHSELAGRFVSTLGANFDRVRQCVKLHDADAPDEYRNEYDGCALLDMKSWDGLWAVRSHPSAATTLKTDEERVFAGYVEPWTMACESELVRMPGDGACGLVWFLRDGGRTGDATFLGRVSDRLTEIAALPVMHGAGVVLNSVCEQKASPYDFAAVIELWFTDTDAALRAMHDVDLRAAHAELFASGSVALLVRVSFAKCNARGPDGVAVWRVEGA